MIWDVGPLGSWPSGVHGLEGNRYAPTWMFGPLLRAALSGSLAADARMCARRVRGRTRHPTGFLFERYEAPAEQPPIFVVECCTLAWRDGLVMWRHRHVDYLFACRNDRRVYQASAVAHHYLAAKLFALCGWVNADPVDLPDGEFAAHQGFPGAEDEGVARRVFGHHI